MQFFEWLLTPECAAVHQPSATAVVADLHLGYNDVRRRNGDAIPVNGIQETCARLTRLFARCEIQRLVIAGDLCEGVAGAGAVGELTAWLARRGVELAGVVPGNHDHGLDTRSLPLYPDGVVLDGWSIVHGDETLPAGQVVHGHWHPCFRQQQISARCFLLGERRLVLPAFSDDAAGVNVLSQPPWRSYRCAVIAGDAVLDFGLVAALKTQLGSGHPGTRTK